LEGHVLGLKHNLNLLADYDADWPLLFLEEKRRLSEALGSVAKGIKHFGSTAVPGLRARPILDMMVGVDPLQDWMKCRAPLEKLGYDYADNAGVPGHHIFGRGRDLSERTHLLHVVQHLGTSWTMGLTLRAQLRSDPRLRDEYAMEKERAVAASPEGRARYNEIKGPFLESVKVRLRRD
jgi:GrpB-like predicted nucleotidyltransferase (UPF0157 family)